MSAERDTYLDTLSEQSYTAREGWGYRGQNSFLRPFDITDHTDMQRACLLQDEQQRDYFFKEELTGADVADWLTTQYDPSSNQHYMIFGIAGNKAIRWENGKKERYDLPKCEKGEIQGWVYFDPYAEDEVEEMVARGIIPEPFPGQPVLQLQIVKLPGAESGQMASAIRQACACLCKLDFPLHAARIKKEAEKRGCTEEELWEKQGHKPSLLIVGTISPRNKSSMRSARHAGRVRSKYRLGSGTADGDNDYYYVTDWYKLHRIMARDALAEQQAKGIFPKKAKVIRVDGKVG